MEIKPLMVAPLIILGLATLLGIVGLSTNSWLAASSGTVRVSAGLWNRCFSRSSGSSSSSDCVSLPVLSGFVKTIRAFVFLGMFASVFGVVLLTIRLINGNLAENKAVTIGAMGLSFGAGICYFIGAGVYAGEFLEFDMLRNSQLRMSLSWSFGLILVAAILSLVASSAIVVFGYARPSQIERHGNNTEHK